MSNKKRVKMIGKVGLSGVFFLWCFALKVNAQVSDLSVM